MACWRHDALALVALSAERADYPHKGAVIWSFDVFIVINSKRLLTKPSGHRRPETPLRSYDVTVMGMPESACERCYCVLCIPGDRKLQVRRWCQGCHVWWVGERGQRRELTDGSLGLGGTHLHRRRHSTHLVPGDDQLDLKCRKIMRDLFDHFKITLENRKLWPVVIMSALPSRQPTRDGKVGVVTTFGFQYPCDISSAILTTRSIQVIRAHLITIGTWRPVCYLSINTACLCPSTIGS